MLFKSIRQMKIESFRTFEYRIVLVLLQLFIRFKLHQTYILEYFKDYD